MESQLLPGFVFLAIFLLLTFLVQALYSRAGVSSEITRKFLHVSGGMLALFIPAFITSVWLVLALCFIAFVILTITYFSKKLESVHLVRRRSVGSILFPIPVGICFVAGSRYDNYLLYYVPVSLLTFADTMAQVGGHKWGKLTIPLLNNKKTITGSVFFAVTSLLVSIAWLLLVYRLPASNVLFIAASLTILTTLAELISPDGWDNLSVPITGLFILYFFLVYKAGV